MIGQFAFYFVDKFEIACVFVARILWLRFKNRSLGQLYKFFTALLLRENHNFPSKGFQNKTSFLFETRQPRTHVRVLG